MDKEAQEAYDEAMRMASDEEAMVLALVDGPRAEVRVTSHHTTTWLIDLQDLAAAGVPPAQIAVVVQAVRDAAQWTVYQTPDGV